MLVNKTRQYNISFFDKYIFLKCYLMKQDNTIYIFFDKLAFSSIGQGKSKLQKQISKPLILIEIKLR